MNISRFAAGAALAGALIAAGLSAPARAGDYPDQTITIAVAYPPGGFNDQVARMIAEDFSARWDVTVVVANRPGGGTVVGTDYVAKADPDGYTIGISPFAFGVNPGLFPELPYDAETDFRHVIVLGDAFNVLVAHPDFPADTVAELVDYAKAHPGEINYASAGNGSSNHLSGELFKSLTGVDAVHIPYGGSAPARTDLIAGRVDILFDNYTNVKELVETGKLKALGVTLQQETALMPGVPPVSDTVAGYEVTTWWGVIAPAGTPDDVIETLNAALNDFLTKGSTLEVFAARGITEIGGSTAEAEAYVQRQMAQWIPVAKQAQMKVD
ncbi:tripartite tricarboxylate transporter substrate binding protein [Paralimibaculum aggregatum]|uniref:Tripartite tricarboxylate transporter substrate binding protein n=1 Tax=Paralimibaculum aggregatum TaxID=3036245 RepID=A0ABQ6LPJ9_9RHOB|nr:tripartite tricarboxylate transporter substrate binding protein [Limibaculum sp. NKW23]GMG84275.1 tripartite tricarboxylate transporter substrate binding protein [Limibaculum sp. NKW23]